MMVVIKGNIQEIRLNYRLNKMIKCRIYQQFIYNNQFYGDKHYLAKTNMYDCIDEVYYYNNELREMTYYNWTRKKASLFNLEDALSILADLYINGEHKKVLADGEEEKYYFGLEII